MPRYYFHLRDGETSLDPEGVDFTDIADMKREAIATSGEMLKGLNQASLWAGEPWTLWVTEEPEGRGASLLTLKFAIELPGAEPRTTAD
jgi:hypothetical protein